MIELLAAIAYLARPLAAAAGLGGAAWWLGRATRRVFRNDLASEEGWGRAGVNVAVGLALLAALGFWLGIAGWLTFWGLVGGVATMMAFLAWATRGRGEACLALNAPIAIEGDACVAPTGRKVAVGVAFVLIVPLVALALYPPTGFDATMYHLPFARAFVATGGLPFLPDLRFPVFPQASEVLFAEAMLLDGDRAAQLVSLIATLATAAILFGWVRRVAPKEGARSAGTLAAAFFLGGPVVAYLAGNAFCEPVLVLFVAAAFDQLDRFREGDSSGWLLAGVFAGSAAGTKYFGLFPVGVLVAVAVFSRIAPGENSDVRWRRLAWGGLGVALFAIPWYVRNAWLSGNPFLPLFPGLFGASPWVGPSEMAPWSQGRGLAQLLQMVRLPWTLTFDRPEFGRMPPWSPPLMVALAAALFALWRDRRIRLLLGASLLYLSAFFFLPLDARYLLPILPLLCVAGALSLKGWLSRRYLLTAAVLLVLAPTVGWSLFHLHRLGPLPTSNAARDSFLGGRLPAYEALRFLGRTVGPEVSVYGFYAENHIYYAPGRYQGDWEGRAPYREMVKLLRSGDVLADGLRARGVTHLLTVVVGEPPLPRDASFAHRFRLVYDDGKARVWKIL